MELAKLAEEVHVDFAKACERIRARPLVEVRTLSGTNVTLRDDVVRAELAAAAEA